MSFQSEDQRRAVMAILALRRKKGPRAPKGKPLGEKSINRLKQHKHVFKPGRSEDELRAAGFYKQGIKGAGFWARWHPEEQRNQYLHHAAWDFYYPDDPVKPGEQIHHINKNRADNRKKNLAKLPASLHASMEDVIMHWRKKGMYEGMKHKDLDKLALKYVYKLYAQGGAKAKKKRRKA